LPSQHQPQQFAAQVLEAIADPVMTIDRDGRLMFVNAAAEELFGYGRAEAIGRSINQFVAPVVGTGHQDQARDNRLMLVGPSLASARELVVHRKDRSQIPVRMNVSKLVTDTGVCFVGVLHDLTEQHEQQLAMQTQWERLAKAGRLSTMGEMTASIAHEMNQPLTAIAMYAQVCMNLLTQPTIAVDKLSGALQKLSDQALRAGAVNERVQQFVRSEEGYRETHDVNQLLEDIRPLAAGDARSHGIDLSYRLELNLPKVCCVGLNVQQVALNLLRNAFDAMQSIDCKHGNSVSVRTNRVGSAVRVSVVDEGPGIDRGVRGRLFDPFATSKKNGLGLGLSACKSLIADEGGELDYFERTPYGVEFWFSLPVEALVEPVSNGIS